MRTIRLVPLMTVAMAALAVVPTSASARRQGQRRAHATGACHIRLETPKAPLPGAEAVTVVGTVQCAGAKEPGAKQVTLYQRSAPQSGFTALSPVASDPTTGAFTVTTPTLQTDTTLYALAEGAKSAQRTIRVAAQVTPEPPTPSENAQIFTATGGRFSTPKRVEFAGSVKPFVAHERVVLQRESSTGNEEWKGIQLGEVDASGKYVFHHRFLVPGEANIRVLVRPGKLNAPAASTPSSYEISQMQNPDLTLETETDPLAFGQSVKLKGTIKEAKGPTTVSLLETTSGAHAVPVASTTSTGSFEFLRTPARNAIFKVKAGSETSALLFQGVRHQLTFTPPASSATAGQALEFAGSVLPAGRVYLERQSIGGLGWHVIDSTVAPANSFSLSYAFRAPGEVTLRIKVPGGEGHQAIASAPFKINVAKAASPVLNEPANVHLPPEGQV
jgi:hypothetical protein